MDSGGGGCLTGRVRFARITLQGFRNLPLAEVGLTGVRTFLCGQNAQGKTNFLEAAGYVTALRSFRAAETRALIGLGQAQAGLAFTVEHERFGESRITVTLTPQGREVMWEQGKVTRLADFIGKFPTVVFSSHDNQFLRGSPSLRRRWLDLTLAAMDPGYLTALQSYTRAVAERNMLLKQGGRDAGALEAFEHELAAHAVTLVAKRAAGVAELSELFRVAHGRLVPEGESAGLIYAPDTALTTREEFAAALLKARPRDTLMKSTERGPHRDDLDLLLNGRPAKQFASEGQQRCLVIALRLAQAAYFKAKGGVTPVLLCDDVLGELDPERRRKFWDSLEGEPQVIATGTSLPHDAAEWQVLEVVAGRVATMAKAPSANIQPPENHPGNGQPENRGGA
jgi:DNA replication and repair protein RecF